MAWNWEFSEIPIPEQSLHLQQLSTKPHDDCLKSFRVIQFRAKPPKDSKNAVRYRPARKREGEGQELLYSRAREVEGSRLLVIEGLVPQEKYFARTEPPSKRASHSLPIPIPSVQPRSFCPSVTPKTLLNPKDLDFAQLLHHYRDFLWKVNFSNQLKVPVPEARVLKAFVGKGNNANLIKALIRKRWWWQLTDEPDTANFIWTQIKLEDSFRTQAEAPGAQTWLDPKKAELSFPSELLLNSEEASQLKMCDRKHLKKTNQFFPHREGLLQKAGVLDWPFPKVQNHLPRNFVIGNKKALFYTLRAALSAQQLEEVIPLTFHVTQGLEDEQYSGFISTFYREQRQRKAEGSDPLSVWIVKPGESSNRGNGITVHFKPDSVKKIIKQRERHADGSLKTYIIQKYIERPLLYRGRKFDIRHYLAVTSVAGRVKGYWYAEGYIRTSSAEFTLGKADSFVHLTNDAVQAWGRDYGKYERANKLSYEEFGKYVAKQGLDFEHDTLPRIKQICKKVLAASGRLVDPARKCHNFELFGLDFMIDQDHRPFLIEVNSNPCLEINCPLLQRLLPEMLDNLLRLALDPLCPPPVDWPQCKRVLLKPQNNRFELLYDSRLQDPSSPELEKELFAGMGKIDEDDTFEDDGKDLNIV